MELRTYLEIIWRRKGLITLTVLTTMIVVTAGTFLMTPVYSATTTLRVATIPTGSLDYLTYDVRYTDRLMNTYVELASSGRVMSELKQIYGLVEDPVIKAEILLDTELINVTVEDVDPARAAQMANNVARILISQATLSSAQDSLSAADVLDLQVRDAREIYELAQRTYREAVENDPDNTEEITAAQNHMILRESEYQNLLRQQEQALLRNALQQLGTISVIETADPPKEPAQPRIPLNLGLGLLVALAAGIGLAFLFENLDNRLYFPDQIEPAQDLPILAAIPVSRRRERLPAKPDLARDEAFRRLRINLLSGSPDDPPKTILVTSTAQAEGKSMVVANLALAFARNQRKVVIVDADLRCPVQHTIFKLANRAGLSNILTQGLAPKEVIQTTSHANISVLTSGPQPPDPTDSLASAGMVAVLSELARTYDVVLIDAPAVLPVADVIVVARRVDGVLMVVGRGQARRDDIHDALSQLTGTRAHLLGLVMNRTAPNGAERYVAHRRPSLIDPAVANENGKVRDVITSRR